MSNLVHCIVFLDARRIAAGPVADAARATRERFGDRAVDARVFDAESSKPIDIDWRGSAAEVAARWQPPPSETSATTRGRPRLGVVAREVTLLPRHWEWLADQRGGASVTLRRLVDQARQADSGALRRRAQESAHRFMTAMAGDSPGFEEALRALYAGDAARFAEQTSGWPDDVREHARVLAMPALSATPSEDR